MVTFGRWIESVSEPAMMAFNDSDSLLKEARSELKVGVVDLQKRMSVNSILNSV